MPLETFTVVIDGNRLGTGTTEPSALLQVKYAAGITVVPDPDAGLLWFPHITNPKAQSIDLPYELVLITDVDTGVSENIGYHITLTTNTGAVIRVGDFAARAAGATVNFDTLVAGFVGPISESVAVRAEAARDEAEAAAAAVAGVVATNDGIMAAALADPDSDSSGVLSATIAAAIPPSTSPRFGPLAMPAGFPALPCTFYRDNDGIIKHNFDFAAYVPSGATHIYLATTGNDTTGTGLVGAPYRTLNRAFVDIQAGGAGTYVINTGDITMFDRDQQVFSGTITGKTVVIRSALAYTALGYIPSKRPLVTTNNTYTWTLDGTGTYKTTRSGVLGVLDSGVRDQNQLPVALKPVASAAACQAAAGTYYAGATEVWVHRLDGASPTRDSTIVSIGTGGIDPILAGGSRLFVEGLVFCGTSNGNGLRVRGATSLTGGETVVAKDCGFIGSTAVPGNGYMTQQVAKTHLFNCQAAYSQLDAFNYSYDSIAYATVRANGLVTEYQCTGYRVGLFTPGAGSNNTSTGHGGVNILRIGHVGYENTGASIIDVNGCRSVLYDCRVRTPVTTGGTYGTGTAFSFASDVNPGVGEAYLYDCAADDCTVALVVGTGTAVTAARFRKPAAASISGTPTFV